MDLSFSPEEEAFRLEIRSWIRETMPARLKRKAELCGHFEIPEIMEWHRLLYQKGWVAPHWPKEYGGGGFDSTRCHILAEELDLSGAPELIPYGLFMIGPLLMYGGNARQQSRFLPKILSGEEIWCQGYSEPNAGSDLAALRTRAVDAGDSYVVSGQKTWTSFAQHADWIFCLVRTDTRGKKQEGISFLLIDMKSPGLHVRPMLTLAGTQSLCETFFDDVKVPKENLLGSPGEGWTLAKVLLEHERLLTGSVGPLLRTLRKLKRIAKDTRVNGRSLLDDPQIRLKIARLELRLRAHQLANYRALAAQQADKLPGPEASILKLVATHLQQEADELTLELLGPNTLSWFNEPGVIPPLEQWVMSNFCYHRASTIAAGSSEIQKNIIAKRVLGLPSM